MGKSTSLDDVLLTDEALLLFSVGVVDVEAAVAAAAAAALISSRP